MEFSFHLIRFFEKIISNAASEIEMFDNSFEPQLRIADERFGDFQSNGVLPYSKRNGLNPRELAQTLVEKIPDNELWEISIAGPGFINFKLSPEFLLQWLKKIEDTEEIISYSPLFTSENNN